MRVVISAYDRGSSGISSYTVELAKLLSKDLKVSLLAFQDLDLPGVEVIPIRLNHGSRALPLLTFLRNRESVRAVLKDFDVIHETLPPWGSVAQPLITTRWGYLPYLKLAWVRLTGLSFPDKLGAFPVTLQHYFMDRRSRVRAKYVIDVSRETSNFVPPPVEPRSPKSYQCSKLRLLFVSRELGIPRKNLRVVVRALDLVKVPVELHLVGAGRPPSSTHRIVNHGRLPREDVISLMREVDLLVLPSTYEELGFNIYYILNSVNVKEQTVLNSINMIELGKLNFTKLIRSIFLTVRRTKPAIVFMYPLWRYQLAINFMLLAYRKILREKILIVIKLDMDGNLNSIPLNKFLLKIFLFISIITTDVTIVESNDAKNKLLSNYNKFSSRVLAKKIYVMYNGLSSEYLIKKIISKTKRSSIFLYNL